MKEIGSNIKSLRELKGITREVLAADLGLSLSGYAKIERSETELTISKLYKIAEILEVGINELLNFDATKIFNISNNQNVQGPCIGADNIYFHTTPSNEERKLYQSSIERLEQENNKLHQLLQNLTGRL